MTMTEHEAPRVIKFGGVKLKDAEAIQSSAEHVAHMASEGPTVVVVSAAKGVTDMLKNDIVSPFQSGQNDQARRGIEAFYEREYDIIEAIPVKNPEKIKLEHDLHRLCADLLVSVGSDRYADFIADYILSRGEAVSAEIFETVLTSVGEEQGISAKHIPSHALIRTDANFGNAVPDIDVSRSLITQRVGNVLSQGLIPVVDGFAGATQRGEITVMKRNSSDLTAAIIAEALNARELILAKGIPGVYDRNPHEFDDAVFLPNLTRAQATEISNNGGKVLCEGVVEVLNPNIQITVFDPSQPELRSVISDTSDPQLSGYTGIPFKT